MNNDTVLEMRAVSKIYAGHSVLDRLNLEIPAGSVVGLLGKTRARRRSLYGGKKDAVRDTEIGIADRGTIPVTTSRLSQ